jgi:hypothetical protein
MVSSIDLKKEFKQLFAPSARKVEVVDVPKFNFLMVDGYMEPTERPATSVAFQNAMAAVLEVSHALKVASKERTRNPINYVVMPIEGLWWVDAGDFDFQVTARWRWTLMVMQPKHVTETMFARALATLPQGATHQAAARMRFVPFREGLSIQTMHIGGYQEEPKTVARMKAFAAENGLRYRGKHHEIYLGDPRQPRTETFRTVVRHAVEKEK